MASTEYRSPRDAVKSGTIASFPDLYEWNARENPEIPFFTYHDGQQLRSITYAQGALAIRRVARYVRSRIETPGVVAVLALADTMTYILTSLGVIRAGYTVFLISPRNVPVGIADMLRRTGCRHILVSPDPPMQGLAKAAAGIVEDLTIHPMPTFDALINESALGEASDEFADLPKSYKSEDIAMILHSSGTTNHPKPVQWTHSRAIRLAMSPWYSNVDLTRITLSVHGVPMFHGIGVMMYSFAGMNGWTLTAFPPSPPTFPTPINVFDGALKTSSEFVMAPPAFIEVWARDPQKVARMKAMKALIYIGAPLDKTIGDALASQGVSLCSGYGSTEIGAMAKTYSVGLGLDWEYFQLNPLNEHVMIDKGDNKYELIYVTQPDAPLAVINAKIGDKDAYATNDLLERHPTRAGWWKYHGRLDDQIVLSNGEKTNPAPIETIISKDPHIQSCLVFGQGKFQNGVLIEPKPEFKFDPQDIEKLEDFRNKIWQTIERANDFAPQHSRIFKEMILVASPSKPFVYGGMKGLPRRATVLKDYHEEIEASYAAVEESSLSDVAAPEEWDAEHTKAFLRTVVERVLRKPLKDDADFFRNSCDSLQATWIRNTILRVVRKQSPAAAQRVPTNIVFQAPTIATLADAVLRAVHNISGQSIRSAAELIEIAERYSADLPARPAKLRLRETGKDVVLITGTTGGFGCDALEHLLHDDQVAQVYAFNRPGSQAAERQQARFRERGLEEALLSSPKFKLVEAALDLPSFGIEADLLEEIRSSLTHIIHNAWTVNFSLTLPSFEGDLKAVRNLVDLSLSSPYVDPPRIQFTSSIAVFHSCTVPPPVPEVPLEPSSALGSGYGESKWVAEQILYNTAQRAGVPVVSVRVGQISGNKIGHWNEREWFPALVKSAYFTRSLPDIAGEVTFIPGYPAAGAFVEMRNAPEQVLHLVHPRPVPWHTLIAPIAEELSVPLVPYATWLSTLEKTAGLEGSAGAVEAMRDNPALRLLDFFRPRKLATEGGEPFGPPRLSTEKAEQVSKKLAQLPALGEKDARQWVAAWRGSGFLAAPKV